MIANLLKRWYGDFSSEEIKKYTLLGLAFGILIAAYWALSPLKDGIFQGIVGVDYMPYAKMLSLVTVFCLIPIYGKLVDRFAHHTVFYILTVVYALGAFIFALILAHPEYGIPNTVESPLRIVGWLWFVFVESIATLMVTLFWAFATEVSTPKSARRGFPLIMLCAQAGNIAGPWFLRAKKLGFANSAPVIAIAGGLLLLVGILVWIFMLVTPPSEFHVTPKQKNKNKEKAGFFEGLKTLFSSSYLLGIFVFLLAFDAVTTILEFYFKFKVKAAYPDELMRSDYLALFAVVTGLLSFFSLIFGVSNIQRKLGMRASLITLPLLMIIGVGVWWFNPVMLVSGAIVVIFKGLNYSLNQPSIKQLYIPTSTDTRYKAQAWIEVFGNRGSKTVGSSINALKLPLSNYFGPAAGLSAYLAIAGIASFGLLGFWILMVLFVAPKYNKAISEDKLVC